MLNLDQPTLTKNPANRLVWALAVLGLAPLIFFTVALVVVGMQSAMAAPIVDAYKTCAAIILSFLAGIHWGVILAKNETAAPLRSIALAIAAPLIGWMAVFVAEPMCFALLIVGFAGQGAWDNFAAHRGLLPQWFSKIRMVMTIIVVAILAVAMFVTA
jgi:hypothetical protein